MAVNIKPEDLKSFSEHLKSSERILALCGAGLSASSGIPTFRGPGGFWRKYDATQLATPQAFRWNPSLVWQFYSERRHTALTKKPNAAHYALAELARKKVDFLTLTQNIDGLSARAHHDPQQIKYLHGSLFDIKCSSGLCGWKEKDNFKDPIVPALAVPEQGSKIPELPSSTSEASKYMLEQRLHGKAQQAEHTDAEDELAKIEQKDLPLCPECQHLARPNVVWFNEVLPEDVLADVEEYMANAAPIDLMLVVGTSAKVWPAAGYIHQAKKKGARVAVINMDPLTGEKLDDDDWFFPGDAAQMLPELFKGEIGNVEEYMKQGS